jgi:RNA polymerase sigma factor (sigma-70 family)
MLADELPLARDGLLGAAEDSLVEDRRRLRRLATPRPLDPSRERELVERARAGDVGALEALLSAHERLIGSLASSYRGRPVPFDDLVQIGRLALLEAISRYNLSFGVRLWTFASKRVAGRLADAVREQGWPLRLGEQASREVAAIIAAEERLATQLQRWPRWDEVAVELGITQRRLAELRTLMQWPLSVEEVFAGAAISESVAQEGSVDPELQAELFGAEDVVLALEATSADGTLEGGTSDYSEGEVEALLAEYARARAVREGVGSFVFDKAERRSAGPGVSARLADVDRALQRVPTELFVALELHGLKGLPLREMTRATGVGVTTGHHRFKRGVRWVADFLNSGATASILRDAFWAEDLAIERMAGTLVEAEVWVRRPEVGGLFTGEELLELRDRSAGDGWLLNGEPRAWDSHVRARVVKTRRGSWLVKARRRGFSRPYSPRPHPRDDAPS